MKNQSVQIIPSVNFHLWEPCNMRCKFCFAGFKDVKATILPKGHLPKEDALEVVKRLGEFGFSKISFAGGEPTLCPWAMDLIEKAKSFGMTTMLITNGTKITEDYLNKLKGILDWIVISIDSLNPEVNSNSGRKVNSIGIPTKEDYEAKIGLIKKLGFRLKINTVVHRYNFSECMSDFIAGAQPERWKVMRMLPIEGQNDAWSNKMQISSEEFASFIERNRLQGTETEVVPEDNNDMKGSYIMVDPAGRFFDNVTGKHIYSSPILKVGVPEALSEVQYSFEKFTDRKGFYDWG
jgi:radical S-adenosyl methionine domain-containing protein 2